jgi:hypothetical protein
MDALRGLIGVELSDWQCHAVASIILHDGRAEELVAERDLPRIVQALAVLRRLPARLVREMAWHVVIESRRLG